MHSSTAKKAIAWNEIFLGRVGLRKEGELAKEAGENDTSDVS